MEIRSEDEIHAPPEGYCVPARIGRRAVQYLLDYARFLDALGHKGAGYAVTEVAKEIDAAKPNPPMRTVVWPPKDTTH